MFANLVNQDQVVVHALDLEHLMTGTIFQVIVPSTTCLYAMIIYLIAGTVMFAEWEGWNYLDSLYFCFTSLAKIGFGDLVAGASMHLADDDDDSIDSKGPNQSTTMASPLADLDSGTTDQGRDLIQSQKLY